MPHFYLPPRPMMRTTARFHSDQTRRAIRKVFEKRCAFDLFANNLASLGLDPMKLEDVLRDINTDCRMRHL
jgi:hypothetical protein